LLDCPLNGRFGVLGRKWTLSILRDIGFRGIGRFKDLNKSIGQITPRILSIRLRQFEAEGLIEKEGDVNASTPVWQLTLKGKDLIPLLREWIAFRSRWDASRLFQDGQPRTLHEFFL
jgi:DNA-binding HxlR family transcriptional regulator